MLKYFLLIGVCDQKSLDNTVLKYIPNSHTLGFCEQKSFSIEDVINYSWNSKKFSNLVYKH